MDVQDDVIVLIPEPRRYTEYLQGLHGDIWKGVDEVRCGWISLFEQPHGYINSAAKEYKSIPQVKDCL